MGHFGVIRGEVFGFIGFNGAGKSTTSNMLCTLSRPTPGTARPSLGGYEPTASSAGSVSRRPSRGSEPSRHVPERAAVRRPCRQVADRKREMKDRPTGLNGKVS